MILRNGKIKDDESKKKRKRIDLYQKNRNDRMVFVNKRKKIEEKVFVKKKMDQERASRHLPEELFMENILTRLPFRDLAASCSGVSKLWYNLIYKDKRFALYHFVQNQNVRNSLHWFAGGLSLHLLYDPPTPDEQVRSCIFRISKERCDNYLNMELSLVIPFHFKYELVGYCNGLTCYNERQLTDGTGTITVVNLTTFETLGLNYKTPSWKYKHLCHGFGVDPLSQEYKVVLIFTSRANDKFLCMVITLGKTSLWRKITTSTVEMSPPPGSSPFPSRMVTRVSTNFCASASGTLCGGDLFWRMTNEVLEDNINEHNRNKIEMLLSFNLHNEKIQFIRLPPQSTMNEHPCLVLDHLLEFKGHPCVARSEKMVMLSNSHQHCCKDKSSCSCCKVHLYILEDKGKQVWIPANTFDVPVGEEGLLTSLLSCYSGPTSTTSPPARISAVSDQVLLYWFNGGRLLLYNLQKRHLEVVKGSPSCPLGFRTIPAIGSDDSTYRPYMDCRLQAQVENIVSLKTFIPDGEIIRSKCLDYLIDYTANRRPAGWVTSGRASPEYHCFF